MAECCIHCRLNDVGAPPDDVLDDIVGEWPNEFPMPRWLTAASDTWVTREGEVIPIRWLGDSHLYNIHRMLKRIEGQMDEIDEEGDLITPGPPIELFEVKLEAIVVELERRNIPHALD